MKSHEAQFHVPVTRVYAATSLAVAGLLVLLRACQAAESNIERDLESPEVAESLEPTSDTAAGAASPAAQARPSAIDSSTAPASGPGQVSSDSLLVGVIFRDGTAVPIAKYEGRLWSPVWPSPFHREDSLPSPPVVPSTWHVHMGQAAWEVRFVYPILADAYCVRNWAYRTDWADQQPPTLRGRREVVGMIMSESMPILSEDSLPDLAARREQLGLVSNEVRGEGYRAVIPLGYFKLDDRLLGVFLRRGYEGEVYQVYDLDANSREPVAELHGGGC